jgi:ParB family chromosome partitioning protein
MGHARALINVADVDKQLYIFQEIIEKGLSVRKVEELVRLVNDSTYKNKAKPDTKEKPLSFEFQKIQDDLASKFSTKVKLNVKSKGGKGTIEIPFMSEDDLSRILELLDW